MGFGSLFDAMASAPTPNPELLPTTMSLKTDMYFALGALCGPAWICAYIVVHERKSCLIRTESSERLIVDVDV